MTTSEALASTPQKKILVTGAAGFIASRTAALLHQAGHTVVGLDNFNEAYDQRLKEWRWGWLRDQDPTGKRLLLRRLDLTDLSGLDQLMREECREKPFDAVINLAARAGVRASVQNPTVYVETNVQGWLNLLEVGRSLGIKKFVLASTSSLYGKDLPMPYREDQVTDKPLSPYAATKKAAEALAYAYSYLHGFDISILRYFTVYGPAGRPDMAPLRFVQRIREGRPITVFGDGSQSRDFTYVDDIARGTIAALRSVGFATYNLGSDEPVVLMKMIGLVEELTQRKALIEYKPVHPADVPATWANIEKARNELDWSPQTTLRQGLSHLVSWYEENRSWAAHLQTE